MNFALYLLVINHVTTHILLLVKNSSIDIAQGKGPCYCRVYKQDASYDQITIQAAWAFTWN